MARLVEGITEIGLCEGSPSWALWRRTAAIPHLRAALRPASKQPARTAVRHNHAAAPETACGQHKRSSNAGASSSGSILDGRSKRQPWPVACSSAPSGLSACLPARVPPRLSTGCRLWRESSGAQRRFGGRRRGWLHVRSATVPSPSCP